MLSYCPAAPISVAIHPDTDDKAFGNQFKGSHMNEYRIRALKEE